jgi:hypothetical protein
MTTQEGYIPGVCNIGPDEIRRRKRAGWFGLAATFGVWAALLWLDAPALWRLTLFFPATASAIGFVQAYKRFCVYFGLAALFNFGKAGNLKTVESEEYRRKDRLQAWKILTASTAIGLAVAGLSLIL